MVSPAEVRDRPVTRGGASRPVLVIDDDKRIGFPCPTKVLKGNICVATHLWGMSP